MIDSLTEVSQRLAGTPVTSIVAAKSGGNSQIYRVETARGPFALKAYPSRPGDLRDRAETEWHTLSFLRDAGLESVPKPVARDCSGRFVLMEWIEGSPIDLHQPGEIGQATDFISAIFGLSSSRQANAFPLASEACLSAAAIVEQIRNRLTLLIAQPALDRFIGDIFRPRFDDALRGIAREIEIHAELPVAKRRLIPADFGFHNALRSADGRLRYIDFEYFGWDDPVKLTTDFILHPAMRLSADDQRDFTQGIATAVRQDDNFSDRLRRRLPLFALRWALILLNPFRRDRAQTLPLSPEGDALLRSRLEKANTLIGSVLDGAMAAAAAAC